MITEVSQNQGITLSFYPPVPPSTCTAAVKNSAGTVLVSGSATVDSVNTTLATVADKENATLTSETGVTVDRQYWIISAQNSERRALVTVESLTAASKAINVYPAPRFTPVAGDTFRGARVTYALSSSYTGTRDPLCSVHWTVTATDSSVNVYQTPLAIVRTVFDYQCRPEDVRAYLAQRYAHRATELDTDPTRYVQIADRATDLVKRRIRESERWPHLLGDPSAFLECRRLALKIALLDDGIRDGVQDSVTYTDSLIRRLDDETRRAIASCAYDLDDSGSTESNEVRPSWIKLRR